MRHEFEIDGTKFRLAPLKMKASLKAEAILVHAVLPAIGAGFSLRGGLAPDTVGSIVSGLERVDELVNLFVQVCEREHVEGTWTPLAPFVDLVFERKNAKLLAWLLECIGWQFADFFDGTGPKLLEERAMSFASLMGWIGGSGES